MHLSIVELHIAELTELVARVISFSKWYHPRQSDGANTLSDQIHYEYSWVV